jgi:hypothetical protein
VALFRHRIVETEAQVWLLRKMPLRGRSRAAGTCSEQETRIGFSLRLRRKLDEKNISVILGELGPYLRRDIRSAEGVIVQ